MTMAGGLCFAIQDAGVKWLSAEMLVLQILFLRSAIGLVFLAGSSRLSGEKINLVVKRPGMLFVRTVINLISWICFFYGLKYLPLATAVALFFSFPIFLAILSVPMLGEKVGIRRVLGILVGFVGVILITKPAAGLSVPMLLMLTASLGWAIVANITRILGEGVNTSTILFYSLVSMVLVLGIPQFWMWKPVDPENYLLLITVAFFGVIAQFAVTRAYSIAPPSLIAPFEYTALIWAAILGYWLWGDIPDLMSGFGAFLIVASGLYIIHREAVNNRELKKRGRI
jgi:drug/metabolite transporter (DMT)-like permease